jgi:uncharacterized protein YbbC (DUF1343 family)
MVVRLGSERLLDVLSSKGLHRVGVVANPSSIGRDFSHVVDLVARSGPAQLAAIFGPQHGFRSDVQENMIETGHARDAGRRVAVYSLYSETREPTAAMLDGLDAIVIDLQDVGTRIYTYIYTMANCLVAARRHHVPVIVCDRPNPIGGVAVEGPMLSPGFESFVGQFPIPMRHGMTIGELARLFNDHFGIGADLDVLPMTGWQRAMYHDETGVPWVLPSPNLPTLDSAIVYPGTVLFEGTSLSEGRGTTRPFELVGTPGVDAEPFARALNESGLPGVFFRPAIFEPTFHKHAQQRCGGCQIHVIDRHAFRPVITGVALVAGLKAAAPGTFQWRQPPYEYEETLLPFDILAGSSELRHQIDRGETMTAVASSWEEGVAGFLELRRPFLMYE